MVRRRDVESPNAGRRDSLLTPRNLTILMIAAMGTHEVVPGLLPAVQAGGAPSFAAFIAMTAVLDRAFPAG